MSQQRELPDSRGTAVRESPEHTGLDALPTEDLCIHTIRTLAMDAVQAANSGHPGTPMALAPLAYVLWTSHLRYNPLNPQWFDRDRFVLSAGHASMLLYAILYLTGYDLSLADLQNFRQWGSKTPGHPENHDTPGVETTTGPLGQGLMNSVGMAMAEAHLAALFNRPGHPIVDHSTYAICGDGDLMEGASHEAASLAGHLRLGKLVWIYDDNHITIDGDTALTYRDDVEGRFRAYGWHVQNVGDRANDLEALDQALAAARDECTRPSLVILRSHIGYGAPNKEDTASAHGEPLGEEEIRATKRFYGWPEEETFLAPERALAHMRLAIDRGEELEREWSQRFARYRQAHPELAARFEAHLEGHPPDGWDEGIPTFQPSDGPLATRAASGKVLNGFAERVPWLFGGSADLEGSNKSRIDSSGDFAADSYGERNVHWGIREHLMCGACNGLTLHGGVRPYAATFFIFTDYARPAIRLAAMMRLPVIYIMTHDSIGLGEDGPTHQPVEHLASLRALPNLWLIRPADGNEVSEAWRVAVERTDGPTMLVLTRQKLPIFDRNVMAGAEGLRRGAYILCPERGEQPDAILMGSGSEVYLLVAAQVELATEGIDARVVSMPSFELFQEQSAEYRRAVLPPSTPARIAVEAGTTQGWREWVGDLGEIIGIRRFGASAPANVNFEQFGFTVKNVVERARQTLARVGAVSEGLAGEGMSR